MRNCGLRNYDEMKVKVEVEKKPNVKSRGQRVLDYFVEIAKIFQIVWTRK
jgi:hypothetical protein